MWIQYSYKILKNKNVAWLITLYFTEVRKHGDHPTFLFFVINKGRFCHTVITAIDTAALQEIMQINISYNAEPVYIVLFSP